VSRNWNDHSRIMLTRDFAQRDVVQVDDGG